MIDRFDASPFPTKFAAQIRNFDSEGCAMCFIMMPANCWPGVSWTGPSQRDESLFCCRLVDKKNLRRYDNCLSYTLVASKKALLGAELDREVMTATASSLKRL